MSVAAVCLYIYFTFFFTIIFEQITEPSCHFSKL